VEQERLNANRECGMSGLAAEGALDPTWTRSFVFLRYSMEDPWIGLL